MKIVPKLTLALVTGTCLILTANGYLRVRRERRYFEADRVRDHEMIGRSLEATAAAVWKSDGEEAAIHAIDAVNSHFTTIRIRWRGADEMGTLSSEAPGLQTAPVGQPVTWAARSAGGDGAWRTLVPLDANGARRGVIELSEPMTSERRFVRNTIIDTAATTLTLVVVSALLAFVLGQWLVGGRVRVLAQKARKIGLGDFSGPVTLSQHDELTDLAREVNAMCDRLVTTVEQLRHADRLATVGRLAAGVAHELGTPLNVVDARAKMIAGGETTPEESSAFARAILTANDRMTKTIRHLMQFARRGGAQKAPHDVGELARETLDLLRPLTDKRMVRLDLTLDEARPQANVDPGQIQQVITNLTMNAVQALPRGGTVGVSLSRERATAPAELGAKEAEFLCLRVKDAGEGIAPEHLPQVFEPFFTTKDVGEGTGLGLAVTYGIIREHGGWIAVQSEVHVGTTFSVFLPTSAAP